MIPLLPFLIGIAGSIQSLEIWPLMLGVVSTIPLADLWVRG